MNLTAGKFQASYLSREPEGLWERKGLLVRFLCRAAIFAALAGQAIGAPVDLGTSGNAVFDRWRDVFAAQVIDEGYSLSAVRSVLGGLRPDQRVIEADSSQAEFVKPIWSYIDSAVSRTRIETGREHLSRMSGFPVDRGILSDLEMTYGVPGFILLAIWGMESNFGARLGNFDAPRTMATMAALGRRKRFAETQLRAMVSLIDSGVVTRDDLRQASWAGALGHTQFIPATYLDYAVDGDGDGRRHLWTSVPDALASAASYLKRRGWRAGLPWFGQARLAENFDYGLHDGRRRSVGQWRRLGVEPMWSGGFGSSPYARARLILPAGAQGPAFLAFDNFFVIKRYNNSDAYAFSVGFLADALAGRPGLVGGWPTHLKPLSRSEVREAQMLLTDLGYDPGGVDGLAGPRTRAATRSFQLAGGLTPDGFLTQALLRKMRDSSVR